MHNHQFQTDERFYTRLRHRTAIGGAIIFLIPFLLFTVLVQFACARYVRRLYDERLRAGAATNARLLDDVLAVRKSEVESLARALEKVPPQSADAAALLKQFVTDHSWYGLALIADSSGNIVSTSQEVRGNIANCRCLEPVPASQTLISYIPASPRTGRTETFVATPLHRPPGGVLFTELEPQHLVSRFLDNGIAATEDSFLVNAAGEIISPTRRAAVTPPGAAFAAGHPNPFQGAQGSAEFPTLRGADVLAAYQRLENEDAYVVVQVAAVEMQAPVAKLRLEVMLYVLPFLLLGVVLAVLAWRFALDYIQRLLAELYEALRVAGQRERERDLVNQELARRIEHERDLAEQRAQFQARLAEYEKYAALTQLALGAAHEVNNPLLGILSHLELELRANHDPQRQQELEQCIEGSKRIGATMRGLINYARPGPLKLTEVSLKQIAEDTLAFVAHQPLFHNITLENEVPSDLPALHADANQLSQVLMNLLLNSAQAMPHGGRVTISAARLPDEKIDIRVTDTGSGIPPEVLPRIFEPFFTTKRGKGTGLGLSITQAYVRNHGGDIEVESTLEKGTTVRVILPLHQAAREDAEVHEVIG